MQFSELIINTEAKWHKRRKKEENSSLIETDSFAKRCIKITITKTVLNETRSIFMWSFSLVASYRPGVTLLITHVISLFCWRGKCGNTNTNCLQLMLPMSRRSRTFVLQVLKLHNQSFGASQFDSGPCGKFCGLQV